VVWIYFIIILELRTKTREERNNKAELQKLREKQLRAQSPYIRVEDLESNVEPEDTQQKVENDEDKPKQRPRPKSAQRTAPPKKSIKKWDSKGKGGGVKMDYTT
jgi:hypothetical protein